MARKSKADMKTEGTSVHGHSSGGEYMTKASGETHTKMKGSLMSGIVAGLPKRNLPVVIDGICRGIPKHNGMSLSADTMHVKSSATKQEQNTFGSGAFAQGK
jgi:hypothetical protein